MLRKTLRFTLLGIAAGMVTTLVSVFTIFALAGVPEAVTIPIIWGVSAMIGTVFGGIAMPILGWWLLPDVPVRRVVLVVSTATFAGSVLISVLGHGGLGALAGAIAAVAWLKYLEPALVPSRRSALRG
ncbi:MAG TPA: hypothetical protein VFT04_08630 [Gemmatimonadales bacterium]|nr:hypothetical protein [Gemmatimonadales bacterium]